MGDVMERRQVLLGLGLTAGVAALSRATPALAAPAAMAPLKKPARLKKGDTVGLVAPASPLGDRFDLGVLQDTVVAMGLRPKVGPHVLDRSGFFAGDDRARAADINAMLADKDVKAIFAVQGGWGCARVLPFIDWDVARANPKLLVGYSDVTALHLAFAARAGIGTVHGPNAASAWTAMSWQSFRAIAFDGAMPIIRNPAAQEDRLVQVEGRVRTLRGGKAQGRLLGGNLTLVTSLIGTPYLPDFSGAILFLEDVNEPESSIDRMITQLEQAGILGKVAGIVFGQCIECTGGGIDELSKSTLSEVLEQHLTSLGVPVFQGLDFGHLEDQFSIPLGVLAEIDADAGTLRLLESAVC